MPRPGANYTLTVKSTNPASGVAIDYTYPATVGTLTGITTFSLLESFGDASVLTAPQNANGNSFVSWTGCTQVQGNTCTAMVSGNMTVTANYQQVYTLTVNSTDPASGVAIGVSPADINRETSGATSFGLLYDAGTTVTLTAPATWVGSNFSSWTGCTTTNGATCTVAMNANTAVTANYVTPPPTTYTLTVNSTNPASGVTIDYNNPLNNVIIPGVTSFTVTEPAGTTLNLTAPATAGGNNFLSWTGCTSASTVTCSATLNANTTVTANYGNVITVNSTNPSSGVPISVSSCSNNVCPEVVVAMDTSFTLNESPGVVYTLIAPATAAGNAFSSWTGCDSVSGEACMVTSNGINRTVTANYGYTLTVNSANPASGVTMTVLYPPTTLASQGTTSFTVDGGPSETLQVIAPATANGNTFSSWTGCTTATTVTCSVTLNANTTVTANYAAPTYMLTVNSTNPASGVIIDVSPSPVIPLDFQPTTSFPGTSTTGSTTFTLVYGSGTSVTLTAPATASGNPFSSWTGCTTATTVSCDVTLNGNMTVTANYIAPAVAISPNPAVATIGSPLQFTAKLNGTVSSAVTWSVAAPSGSSLSPGTISSSGLYTTPYPAPPTVTVTATSTQNTANNASVTVTLSPPATAAGPALTVDTSNQTHAINPDVYGMNAYLFHATAADTAAVAKANVPVDRWGGDSTERYNYQLDVTNSIDDWFFENGPGTVGDAWPAVNGVSAFDALVQSNNSAGIKTLGTVPVVGWVSKDSTSCSFPKTTYPDQLAVKDVNGTYYAFDPYGGVCGAGVYPEGVAGCTSASGCNIPSDPMVTSIAAPSPTPPTDPATVSSTWADATWTGSWVNYLVNKFGAANSGTGVAIYDVDNEPSWWDSNDADVHPLPFTYDEVTNGDIGTALAIKTVDPTAQVSGPVMDYWWAYFYSKKDIESGWTSAQSSPCWDPWSNPVDREAHGGVPFIQYYLSQFALAETTYGKRLLDYVDLHTYFAATYNGSGVGLTTAGDTGEQQARLNSTRAFWDSAYTDPNYPQPNYLTDPNYTSSCNVPAQAPQLIPMMKAWVSGTAGSYTGYFYPGASYPGTKLAIDEYNFGGLESINGALAQADILGIFGREGLDLGAFWPTQDPSTQIPGMMAFAIYRNYDGNDSTFGDEALLSTSANQGTLSVYGALRTADNTVTVVVINKTYGDLTSTLSIPGLPSSAASGQAYLYSNANLNAIVAQPAVTVTPGSGGAASTIANYTFPAQSITLFVVPM